MRGTISIIIAGLMIGAAAVAFGPQVLDLVQFSVPPTPTSYLKVEEGTKRNPDTSQVLQGDFTFAISWQPAFCEQNSYKPECITQTTSRSDATQFSLHGLWPEPRGREYCGVSNADMQADKRGDWQRLPAPQVSAELRTELEQLMPGTQSYLERHEWIKHGTCAGVDAETYFSRSIALLDAINASGIGDLIESAIGARLDAEDIRAGFDTAFGQGSGNRVTIECGNDGSRRLIDELRLALRGVIDNEPDIATLMSAAPSRQRGCPQGIIDPAGFQ